jgi:hypothetical protein
MLGVRVPSGVPSCIDKKDASKNSALRCGIFAYKKKNRKKTGTIGGRFQNKGA